MVNPIHQIAKLITEHPDIINHNILLESLESKIKKLLTKISNKLPHEINIDEITQFSTQQRFKELGVSRWIAKQVAFNPNLRVDWSLFIDYIAHLKFRDNNKYKALLKSKIQEVIKGAEEWHSQTQNDDKAMTNNEPIIAEFPNGYKIVKLTTREHCEVEGELMDNCVKDYNPEEDNLYSLRSPDGKPKVTIHIYEDGRVNELKGRQNKPPIKKYADLVIPWVNSILKEPDKLFVNPDINFTHKGFKDYFSSLYDEGLLRKLAEDGNAVIEYRIAENPNTPADVLSHLSQNEDWHVRLRVASNPNTPVNILRLLSQSDVEEIRVNVASNPSTPINILRSLSKDGNTSVRSMVASNPNTPINILRSLSKDRNASVRSMVASNPNTPTNILDFLGKDEDDYVKRIVASNPNTPIDILRLLSKDENALVRVEAIKTLEKPRKLK